MKFTKKPIVLSVLAAGLTSLGSVSVAQADDAFFEALTGGKVSFSARARYESVEQDNALKDADAFTLRTTLGYKTGSFRGLSGFIEAEDISDLSSGHYNDKVNGDAAYSVVADPDGTDMNQAFLQYNGFDTEFKFGRQELTYRGAPFHRFVGNVLWRQNHQSFDAFTVSNTSVDDLKASYAYINKVNTILGGTVAMDSHLVNLQYTGLSAGKVEGYGYFLDYEDAAAKSSQTIGLRFSGGQKVSDAVKVIYTAEYANQSDYADGVMDDQGYYLGELGGKYKGWLAKVSYEMQEGDGTYSFKTPLGTNHAFQGWADSYLATPSQGLQDIYFTVVGNVLGAKLVGVYHDFETDEDGLDAGSEFDLLAQKTFQKHYTVGLKYADFDAGDASLGKVDTQKFWVYGQVKF